MTALAKLAAAILAVAGTATALLLFDCVPWLDMAPAPFVWRDVALVHLVCVTPLAILIGRRLPAALSILLGTCLLAASAAMLACIALPDLGVIRAGLAFTSSLGAVLLARVALRDEPGEVSIPAFIAAAAIAILVPATYVHARCRHDLTELADYLQQSRLKEAQALARRLLRLDGRLDLHGQPLAVIASRLDQTIAELEASVASPLPGDVATGARLDRARRLAMLDETDAALELLSAIQDAEADNLRGAIHEARGEWTHGLHAYEHALLAWQSASPAGRTQGRAQALTGIAYCQRKLGHYAEAEASYRELLNVAPNADTHFLLAQFYEDAQQAQLSRLHARKAILLAPDRYRHEGEKLIRKLAVYQFGCFAVFRAENASARPTAGVGRTSKH